MGVHVEQLSYTYVIITYRSKWESTEVSAVDIFCTTNHVRIHIGTTSHTSICTATLVHCSNQAGTPWWFLVRDWLVLTNFALMNRAGLLFSTSGSQN